MSEQVVGTVAGIKPRGTTRGFWTAEIEVPGKQYPVKVSFHQFKKDSEEPTGYLELLQQAMGDRRQIVAEYYETEGEYNGKPVTYRNGTHFEIANGQVAAQVPLRTPQAERQEGTTGGGSAPRGSSATYNDTTKEIEVAWSLGVLLQFEEYRKDPALLSEKAKQLVRLKRQIASEL